MLRATPVVVAAALLLAPVNVRVQTRDPMIDVHLHAQGAASQGPPPLGMCTPLEPMPLWTQQTPFADVFLDMFKKPRCADPVWSPMTDADLMNETVAIMKRLNVVGVLGGTAARVDAWIAAAPRVIARSTAVINEAPFLTAAQKRDILYNNAARFLRLSKEEMSRHRSP